MACACRHAAEFGAEDCRDLGGGPVNASRRLSDDTHLRKAIGCGLSGDVVGNVISLP